MIEKPWFRAKRYGWGWGLPLTWQGWLTLGLYVIFLICFIYNISALAACVSVQCAPDLHVGESIFALACEFVAATGIFFLLCYAAGEPLAWRWGKRVDGGEDGMEMSGSADAHRKHLLTIFFWWLPFALVISALTLLIYVTVQQDMRQAANDPQIQIAEDTAAALDAGALTPDVVPIQKVAIDSSLAPYVAVFDSTGTDLASSGLLNGSVLTLPPGVFQYVQIHGEDRFTWEPVRGVRQAAVVVGWQNATVNQANPTAGSSGYVLAGRSLRDVEQHESSLGRIVALTWLIALIVTFFLVWLAVDFSKKQ